MENVLPKRKAVRLKDYDYRQNGCYFITICTHEKKHMFGNIVGIKMIKNQFGEIICNELKTIEEHHKNAEILNSVIMPNHIHIIIKLETIANNPGAIEYNEFGKPLQGSISTIIGSFKSSVSKTIHLVEATFENKGMVHIPTTVWQPRFYEHIIRDEDDYWRIWKYIDENPQKWNDDCYF